MLAPLQQQLRAIVDLLPEGESLALAGGGALIVRGVVSRLTRDLDYLAPPRRESPFWLTLLRRASPRLATPSSVYGSFPIYDIIETSGVTKGGDRVNPAKP